MGHNEHNAGGYGEREGRLESLICDFNCHFPPRDIPHCERKESFPAGDYQWVARKPDHEDRVLDCVIERKTFTDLGRSLVPAPDQTHPPSRMYMQKKKLRNTGIRPKLFSSKANPRASTYSETRQQRPFAKNSRRASTKVFRSFERRTFMIRYNFSWVDTRSCPWISP